MKPTSKWIEGLGPDTPVEEGARSILRSRLRALLQLQEQVADSADPDARLVHSLRVAARRAEAALRLFRPWIGHAGGGADVLPSLSKRLRRLRRAAGAVRDCDIHIGVFQEVRGRSTDDQVPVADYLIGRSREARKEGLAELIELAQHDHSRMASWRRKVGRSITDPDSRQSTLTDVARRSLPDDVRNVRNAAAADLSQLPLLHALRLATKRLRYSLELIGPALGDLVMADVHPRLAELQERLGEINDTDRVVGQLEAEIERLARPYHGTNGKGSGSSLRAGVEALRERYRVVRDRRMERFAGWWATFDVAGLLNLLDSALGIGRVTPQARLEPPLIMTVPSGLGVRGVRAPGAPDPDLPRRFAAIDVGSNSTRLVIAEAHSDGPYRVLDDEKEMTRLARGLVETGRLDAEVMDRAATVIARFRAIAEGYKCNVVRAIATAAVREAANGQAFVELVQARAGVTLRVISADEEARLAYRSVSHTFGDMATLVAGVVDIGGASTEVVLSSRGVIDEVYTLPLGAVCLTERFGGPEDSAGDRFKAMRRWVRREVARAMPDPALRPELLVGTGGTFTALASMAMKRDRTVGEAGSTPISLQGYQVRRGTLREILEELRGTGLKDRARVPGLSPERADIIVGGLIIVDAVLRHLGVRRLRVHDLGVRDGLMLSMVREVFPNAFEEPTRPARAGRPGRLRAARRLAQSCRYEEQHSEHVASLALQIFSGLAPLLPRPGDLWTEAVARELLEAGAVLHDIGYLINYAGHHKHAHHLIMHADLSGEAGGGFTRREVEIVAHLARYHRRGEPRETHASFAALSEEDRTLVRRLAAVLRIADGLDRTHTQNVRAVRLRIEEGTAAVFELDADDDPATDVWGASRKAGLFREVFRVEPRFEWTGRPAHAEPQEQPTPHAAAS
jgi:exopolyphosphatase/guanosine-5'-triphosphate,3'-diphosphate pyrophosphatase